MIEQPTAQDIGRRVIYHDGHQAQEGVISSLVPDMRGGKCKHHVFVRFRGPGGELTPCSRLEWADGQDR